MVSAELALAFPAVVLVLALALAGLTYVVELVRCEDAARAAARAASRGESDAVIRQIAASRAPEGADILIDSSPTGVAVHVVADGPRLVVLPAARGEARALWEPGAAP